MKVKELIENLEDMDPEAEVILQKDPEGNGYFELDGCEELKYLTPEAIEKCDEYFFVPSKSGYPLHPEDVDDGEHDQDVLDQTIPSVVLWPVR